MDLLVNIDVPDLGAGEAFYIAALGLERGRRFEGTVELIGASSRIYLLEKRPGSRPSPESEDRRDYHRHWTPVHLDFVVDDLDAAVKLATDAGATVEVPARRAGYGRIALCADPFGNGFCLIEFSADGYDAIAIRQA